MKRWLRWIKRIVLGLIAFAIVAVVIVIAALHTDWGRNRIRMVVVEQLQKTIPGSTVESLSGSPFGEIVLRGVTLMGGDRLPIATIAELRVAASLGPLLGGRVHVDSLALSGVQIFVRRDPAAQAPRAPPQPPSTWNVELPAITVDDARITVETATGTELIDQFAVAAAVQIPLDGPLAGTADVRGSWRGKPIHVRALAAVDATTKVPFASVTLGDASLVATGVEIGDTLVAASLRAFVPAALVRELTEQELPADIELAARATPGGNITIASSAGVARLDAALVADLAKLHVRGVVTAEVADLAVLLGGKHTGSGTVVVAVDGSLEQVRGIVTTIGVVDGNAGTSVVAFDASLPRTELVASGTGGPGGAAAFATIEQRGTAWQLVRSTVVAGARNVAGMRTIDARLSADGRIWPEPALTIRGSATGTGFRKEATRVARLHADLSGEITEARQHIVANVTVTDARSGTMRVPAASLAADATIAGTDISVALGEHRVETADGAVWSGSGGTVALSPDAITITEVSTGTGNSRVTVASARIGRFDSSLTAKVQARDVALSIADPAFGGTVDADLDVGRKAGRWRGIASVRAHRVAIPKQPILDATVTIALAGRKVTVDGTVGNPQLGRTTLGLTVVGPRDIIDPNAWRQLPRAAIERASIAFAHIDAAALGSTGTLDGELTLGPTDARGELHVRGIVTKGGIVDADVTVTNGDAGAIALHATAQTAGLPPSTVDAAFVLPARPFDPLAWKQLGRQALLGATFDTSKIHVDPALLARFGLVSPYSADVSGKLTIKAGVSSMELSVDVRGLVGGKLRAPIDVDIEAGTDAKGTHAEVSARSGGVTVNVSASSPLTIERALLLPNISSSEIDATVTIPDIRARDLLGLLGETDVLSGIIGGTITVRGTIAAPIVRAQLAARGLAMKASTLTNKPPPTLDSLEIDARWAGDRAEVTVTGLEGKDRLLKISAHGNPRDPGSVVATLEAANFDIAPLVAFGTGPLRAARATVSGMLKIKGLDPKTGSIRGELHIRDGRFPLSPMLGTLRRASLDLEFKSDKLEVKFDGRLGAGGGSISGKLTGDIVGAIPSTAHLEMTLKKVSPIGAMQPQIDATIVGNWANQGELWSGSLAIRNGKVYIPPETGNELLITGTPPDMFFVDKQRVTKKGRRPPTKPLLITKVAIGNTDIDIDDTDFRVRAVARGTLMVEVGIDGVGVRGQILTTRGALDIAGRRYRIEQAIVDFDDGTLDPRLAVRVVHDFKNLTLTVEVDGKASKPVPHLHGDPGSYTEGQLLSFLLGGEPTDEDSTAQQNQAVVSGGLAILSGRIGKKVNKLLPIKVDSINYEAETVASSKAIRFGKQLTARSYLVLRQHPVPRADENSSELVFEYQFRPNLLFEGTVGERAKGGDFLWRRRW